MTFDLSDVYGAEIEKIYKYFYYRSRNRHVAEDLSSETFLRFTDLAMTNDIAHPLGYLYAIASRVWLEYLRQKIKNPTIAPEFLDLVKSRHSVEVYLDSVNRLLPENRTKKLLAHLPEKQQRILQLRFCGNLSIADVAREMNTNKNDIKVSQARAIKKLRLLYDAPEGNGATE
jgi:RNA polymerase sigma-70 factor, ECF subfamily